MLRLDDNKKSNEKKILFDIVNKINKEAKKEQVSVPYYLNKLLYKKDINTFSDVCSYLYALDMINLNLFTDDNMIDSFRETRELCEENAEKYLDETVVAIYKDILYKQKIRLFLYNRINIIKQDNIKYEYIFKFFRNTKNFYIRKI